jgi:hypothetical protein
MRAALGVRPRTPNVLGVGRWSVQAGFPHLSVLLTGDRSKGPGPRVLGLAGLARFLSVYIHGSSLCARRSRRSLYPGSGAAS